MDAPEVEIECVLTRDAEALAAGWIEVSWLEQVARLARPECLAAPGAGEASLGALDSIEITLMTDEEIGRVHERFLADPAPTDVITFHHGEILISLDTARRQSQQHGFSPRDEVALYLVHGLLHLAGWDDHEPAEAARMASLQQRILERVLTLLPGETAPPAS